MSLKELGASINLLIINNQSCQWPKTDKNLMKFSHFVFSKVYEWMECKGISLNHIMTLFISFNYKTLMKKTCFAFWPKYRWPHEGKLSSAYTWTLVLKNNERAVFFRSILPIFWMSLSSHPFQNLFWLKSDSAIIKAYS